METPVYTRSDSATDATNSLLAGTLYVRPSGAVSDKYLFTYVDGQLIITNRLHGRYLEP